MNFGSLLKAEQRFAPVATVCMAAGQEVGLGNPHAVFVLSELNLGEWYNHCVKTLSQPADIVKQGDGGSEETGDLGMKAVERIRAAVGR